MNKIISIIVPVRNEDKNIFAFHAELGKVWKEISDHSYEIIFVNDGSIDKTGEFIKELCSKDPNVKSISFSRNFGKEIATSAGLLHATGHAAIMIDGDMQHPLELIPQFIKQWNDGSEVVVGVRNKNEGEGFIRNIGSALFYKMITGMGDTFIEPRATDYRLIDRNVINEFNRFTERNRITRGLIDWLGFKRSNIHFNAYPRNEGTPQYSTVKLIRLAFTTFVSHSLFPLKLAGYLGILITTLSAILGAFIFIEKFILDDPWSLAITGTAILGVIILFLVGIVLSCLGIIALYIASIHNEVVNRPLYVIRSKENL